MTKYVLDTNLYVRAFRSRDEGGDIESFYLAFAPVTYLSSVVMHELAVGSKTRERLAALKDKIARPFLRTGRLITPTHAAWVNAGEALARLAREDKTDLRSAPKSLVHDLILAASCREAGAVLITDNDRDFRRIQRVLRFDFVAPWPRARK